MYGCDRDAFLSQPGDCCWSHALSRTLKQTRSYFLEVFFVVFLVVFLVAFLAAFFAIVKSPPFLMANCKGGNLRSQRFFVVHVSEITTCGMRTLWQFDADPKRRGAQVQSFRAADSRLTTRRTDGFFGHSRASQWRSIGM